MYIDDSTNYKSTKAALPSAFATVDQIISISRLSKRHPILIVGKVLIFSRPIRWFFSCSELRQEIPAGSDTITSLYSLLGDIQKAWSQRN